MRYRSPARCSLLRLTPFHVSSAWSHHSCVIDVYSHIDTDGAALPPARCDISTLADIFIFVCPSIALSSSANRSPIEAPPSLARGDFATFIGKFLLHFLHSFSSHPFVFSGSSLVLCWQHLTPHWQLLRAGAERTSHSLCNQDSRSVL